MLNKFKRKDGVPRNLFNEWTFEKWNSPSQGFELNLTLQYIFIMCEKAMLY